MKKPECLPCSQCGKLPNVNQYSGRYCVECENGCYEMYEGDDTEGRWFQTFPWKKLEDAIDEWNQAVRCNNGIVNKKLMLFPNEITGNHPGDANDNDLERPAPSL